MARLAYVDSPVALRLALDEPLTAAAKRLLRRYQRSGYRLISSELLRLELRQVLFREFGSFTGASELVSRFALVRLIPPILAIAEGDGAPDQKLGRHPPGDCHVPRRAGTRDDQPRRQHEDGRDRVGPARERASDRRSRMITPVLAS